MKSTSKLIAAFVTLMIGAVFIGTISSEANTVTGYTNVGNESIAMNTTGFTHINTNHVYTITHAPSGWQKQESCIPKDFAIKNSTGHVLTKDTDYVVYLSNGTFSLKDTTATNDSDQLYPTNYTWVDYNYCANTYLNSSWGRTVLNLVGGFFAIALMIISVGLFYSVGKDAGII